MTDYAAAAKRFVARQNNVGKVRAAAIATADQNPDDFAQANRLAQETGMPVEIVAENRKDVAERAELTRLDGLQTAAPMTAQWLADPRRMGLARDDTHNLAGMEQSLRTTGVHRPTPEPSFMEEVIGQAHSGWIRGKNYVNTFVLDPLVPNLVPDDVAKGLGSPSATDYATNTAAVRFAGENRRAGAVERLSAATQAQQQEIADAKGWGDAAKAIATNPRALAVTMASSIGQGGPGLMATAAASVFGPGGTAAAAGTSSFAIEYGNAIATSMSRAGVDDTDPASVKRFLADPKRMQAAREYAVKRGVPIALFDMLTAGLAGRFLAAARLGVTSAAIRTSGEVGMQAAGGAAGELSAQVLSGDEINPADVLTEAFAEMPTAITEVPGNYRHAREQAARVMQSAQESESIQTFTDTAAASKLAKRAPEELEAHVAAVGERDMFIEAAVAKELFQAANVDPVQMVTQLTGSDTAFTDAEAMDGDLTIPASKWASVIAQLPNAKDFARNARFTPDALSAVELATFDPAEIAGPLDQVTPPMQQVMESAQRVEDDVRSMLTATKVYTPADSARQAKLYGAVFGSLAQRLDTDAYTLYEPFGLQIKQGGVKPKGVRALYQKAKKAVGGKSTTPRGRMLIFTDRTLSIELLKGADASTFLHESAHFFWEVFADAATLPSAPQALRDDYTAALAWFGVTSPQAVTDAHLEQWARGFEKYLGEGKAPTPELQSLFSRFRVWLLDVYRHLSRLNVELSPEIRQVFDRMLATDDELTAAQSAQGMQPLDLGNEPAALGLTERQWSEYTAKMAAADEEARSDASLRVTARHSAEATAFRQEQRDTIRSEVERGVTASAGMRAMRVLSGDTDIDGVAVPAEQRGLKVDAAMLLEIYGQERADILRGLGIAQQGGIDPDVAAAALGFPSGDAMVQAIESTRAAQEAVHSDTDMILAERHPNLPDTKTVAMDAAHSPKRLEAIENEMALLAQLAKQPKPDRRRLRAAAAEIIARQAIRNIRPHMYLLSERRAARKAARAAASGNYAAALAAKRQQALSAALYSEARQTVDKTELQINFANRLEQPTARKRFGKAGLIGPLEQVLELYSFRPLSDKQRDRTATLRGWYDRMQGQDIDPQIPDAVMQQIDASRLSHYRDLTPLQLDEVIDVLRLLDHQAHEAFELRLAGDKLNLEAAAKEFSEGARKAFKDRGPPPASESLKRTIKERSKGYARAAASILIRLRTVASWMDGEGNVEGPFYRMIIRPLDRAQASYLDAMDDYGHKVADLFDKHLKAQDLSRPFWIATIRQNLSKGDILAVALNIGNASNLQRMQEGRGWGDIQMMEILGHMTKPDWDFVQATWDTLETLWPQITAQQQRLTGIEPPKVEARPVQTAFGKYRGGYYPLVYDRDSTEWRAFVNADTDSFFDPLALTALPPNGHTKERVHRARIPVKLDLGVIPSHLSNILKDLTHRETVLGIRKLTKAPDVVRALNDTLGPEMLDMLDDKLREVATDQVMQAARALKGVAFVSRGIRRHVGIMAQGLNVMSGVKQTIGVMNASEVMIKRHGKNGLPLLALGYKKLISGWGDTVDVVAAQSGEMRHRLNTADVDIRNAMNRYLSGATTPGLKGQAKRVYDGSIAHAYIIIRYMQTYLVDMPLWLAAHEGALAKGLAGDAAVAAADDAVIISQGAGGSKDTALIEGNIPGIELFTMFYSYGSAYLNRQMSMGRDVGKAVEGGRSAVFAELPLLMARMVFLVMLPVILDDLFNQMSGAEDGPDDDESYMAYYGTRMFAYLFYGIPGIRDYAGAKFGYRVSPAQSIGDAYKRLANDIERVWDGKDVKARKVVRDAVNVAGYTLGMPLAGPWKHIDYMWRVAADEENPESIPEFAAAAVVGKREER